MAAATLWRAAPRPRAEVSSDLMRLDVTLSEQELQLTLRRLDGQPEPGFAAFSEGMRLGDFLSLFAGASIDGWRKLPPVHDNWSGEWTCELGEWRVNVHASAGGSMPFDHESVLRRLIAVLADDFPRLDA